MLGIEEEVVYRQLTEGKITLSQFLEEMLRINTQKIKKGEL
jgi:hypothetical protein